MVPALTSWGVRFCTWTETTFFKCSNVHQDQIWWFHKVGHCTCDERWRRLSLRRFVRAFALRGTFWNYNLDVYALRTFQRVLLQSRIFSTEIWALQSICIIWLQWIFLHSMVTSWEYLARTWTRMFTSLTQSRMFHLSLQRCNQHNYAQTFSGVTKSARTGQEMMHQDVYIDSWHVYMLSLCLWLFSRAEWKF